MRHRAPGWRRHRLEKRRIHAGRGEGRPSRVRLGDIVLVEHSTTSRRSPASASRKATASRHFKVLDRRLARFALELIALEVRDGLTVAAMKRRGATAAEVTITFGQDGENIGVELHGGGLNRFWIRLRSEPGEHLWGGGEQFSHFSLAGRRFPMWTQEPGVGRDLTTRMALIAENDAKAGARGGDVLSAAHLRLQPPLCVARRLAGRTRCSTSPRRCSTRSRSGTPHSASSLRRIRPRTSSANSPGASVMAATCPSGAATALSWV
ncbi:MAG: hypothetical protein IPF60_12860 [Betaproteobacteria bacterium]|nr:hypothetical protein [Betaproteobacteria bacterium]